jgi:hypothetical protein
MWVLLTAVQLFFAIVAVLLFAGALQTRHFGMLLGAATYGVSGWYSFELAAWWPLGVGFLGAWILRLVGADPGAD